MILMKNVLYIILSFDFILYYDLSNKSIDWKLAM